MYTTCTHKGTFKWISSLNCDQSEHHACIPSIHITHIIQKCFLAARSFLSFCICSIHLKIIQFSLRIHKCFFERKKIVVTWTKLHTHFIIQWSHSLIRSRQILEERGNCAEKNAVWCQCNQLLLWMGKTGEIHAFRVYVAMGPFFKSSIQFQYIFLNMKKKIH